MDIINSKEINNIIILLAMIFCHIIADYNLQGWLASAKQKSWWEKNASEDKYKRDYVAALFMHSFSWTFIVMLIPTIYEVLGKGGEDYLALFIFNIMAHMIVDDAKANKRRINLCQDQLIHIFQIIITWVMYFLL